jgi:hypothetical protein
MVDRCLRAHLRHAADPGAALERAAFEAPIYPDA